MFSCLWDKRIIIKQTPARRTKLIKLNTFNFIIRNSKTNKRTNKMNTINEQTATLTKLIAEIVELDSDKQCLSVELDYLIRHLRLYKQTCEECEDEEHRREYPDHRRCDECDCCIGCECCECDKPEPDEESEEEEEEECEHCECEGCRGWKEEWGDEEGTTRVCEDATCGKEFSMYDPHYYDDDQCLCYCCEECYKNDSKDEEEETPTCGFCGRDAGHSPIEHPKWDELYFCSEKCCNDYE